MSKKSPSIDAKRHSLSHILAQAVLDMFPEAKLGIGPTIENGFYYDFDLPRTLIPEDLPILEKKMKHTIKQNQKFEQYDEPITKSIEFLKKTKQDYKIELAADLKEEGEKKLSFYKNDSFVDMCKGPHVDMTGQINIGTFKLDKIAGAYWKGDEKRPMLQRIYGLAFDTKEELDAHLRMIKEAEKRDHRKLGKELDLFSFHEEGVGFPFWHPRGMILRENLIGYWRDVQKKYGYQEVNTPIILREELWHQSGHWDNYKENMYFTEIDEEGYAIKPMNCPGGILIYKNNMHSYREFPLRWGELGLVHRYELSGVLHGLFRMRSFTQDDAHIFCTKAQIKDELKEVLNMFHEVYSKFGFEYRVELSTRPEKYIGDLKTWNNAEKIMKEAIKELKMEYTINEGDGAFYGSKFDFHLKDCIGRTWQCGTCQLDFSMPECFEMEYINEKGKKERPIMIHRTVLGSLERFIGILTEHFAAAFPVWLAPVQAVLIPIATPHEKYAEEIRKQFFDAGICVELMTADETLGKRIREAEKQKIPYMLVVGDSEKKGKSVNVRSFHTKEQKSLKVDSFMKRILEEIKERKLP
jgi:threonyl-tRNA synthetase